MTDVAVSVDVIIVNWNSGDQLRVCLYALSRSHQKGYRLKRVVVVDNASADKSANGLEYPQLPLVVIRNNVNRGFGVACNQGAAGSTADYLLFLNPDTRVFEQTLADSIRCMESPERSTTGILGVQLIGEDGSAARSCARFLATRYFIYSMFGLNRLLPKVFHDLTYTEWDHSESRPIEHVIGAYFLVRKSVFTTIGGFDERFFVYFEDVDLSLRAQTKGWSSYFLATVKCCHSGGGTSNQIKARRLFYSLRSRIVYAFKHFTAFNAIALLLATLLIEPISRLGQALLRRSLSQAREVVQAYSLLLQHLPALLSNPYLRKTEALRQHPERLH